MFAVADCCLYADAELMVKPLSKKAGYYNSSNCWLVSEADLGRQSIARSFRNEMENVFEMEI